ncbi:Formylmethionine deformylase [Cynara cardunculus var. scolymus]|uniref:Peptide deformylase n=1 Tax=Cynara cardunculus var. scolymus TaxID=59895 RepID=A0A124SHD3_CYNCS|nr:Formylmethionine deformylase [Cynara cardunculus var. scolymus]
MACANWLHLPSLSHGSFRSTSCQRRTDLATFQTANSSEGWPIFSSNYQYRPPAMGVQAQAKRGSLQKKEEEIATATPADMHFEAPLKIVLYPDPILRAKNKRVDTFDENLKKLVDEMFDLMYKTDGIGLSAPQVGINVRLMVFNPIGERGEGEEIVLVNPQVTRYSKKLGPFTEGCLSFPGINADVVRPEAVKVDAQDITGAKFSVSLSRLPARGILFFDRMTGEVVDSIRSELLALEQKYEDRTGLSRPESIESRKRWKAGAGFGGS